METPADKCECCNQEKPIVGVAAIPGIPMSIAWCKECLMSGAIPYWALVANTACIGGTANSADWWKELTQITLEYFNKTTEEFENDVKQQDLPEQT